MLSRTDIDYLLLRMKEHDSARRAAGLESAAPRGLLGRLEACGPNPYELRPSDVLEVRDGRSWKEYGIIRDQADATAALDLITKSGEHATDEADYRITRYKAGIGRVPVFPLSR
jgi:hypothetical protein